MRTFTIGQNLQIDVLRHVRVDGTRDPNEIADYFVINARWQGIPIDFYPNEGRRTDPLAFGFAGPKVVPISRPFDPATGQQITEQEVVNRRLFGQAVEYRRTGETKRGGDFRGMRLWRVVARRLGQAVLARQLGMRVRDLTSIDEAGAGPAIRRLLEGNFTAPADTRLMTIDGACRFLRDAEGDLAVGAKPPGTVVDIDVGYDGDVNSDASSDSPTGTTNLISINFAANQFRTYLRFPLTAIPAGATINSVNFQINLTANNAETGEGIEITPYADANANTDPEGQSAATKYSNCFVSGNVWLDLVCDNTTGSKSGALAAAAATRVEANLDASDILSLGLSSYLLDFGDTITTEADDNAGSDPATITVDYTVATKAPPFPTPARFYLPHFARN